MKTPESKWPDEIRLLMIDKSEIYQGSEKVYQYGYYDGFQKAIEYLKNLNKEHELKTQK